MQTLIWVICLTKCDILKWILKVIETDDNFEAIADGHDYLVDFLDLSFPSERPHREHAYLEVRSGKKSNTRSSHLAER